VSKESKNANEASSRLLKKTTRLSKHKHLECADSGGALVFLGLMGRKSKAASRYACRRTAM